MKTTRINQLKNKNFVLSNENGKNNNINAKLIYNLYKKEFIDECDTIIIEKQKSFLEKYFNKIHLIIKCEYGDDIFEKNAQINDIIKKCELDFINEVYYPMYNSCMFALKKYNTIKVRNISKEYLTNVLPHCSFNQIPLHTCGSKFIHVNNINNKSSKKINYKYPSYALCIRCHKCYYDSCIKMFCPFCQMKFYSYLNEKNMNNEYPATWKKYHCDDYMNNEQMTCIKCEDKFWVKDNVLFCKNCKLEVKPEDIIWTCIICKKEFKSGVKIYNELEFKEINYEIKNALLFKKVAKPCELPCKCIDQDQINNVEFYHKLNGECNGILYYGSIDNKEFLVCSLCKKMTYLNKFYWNCPICKQSFISQKVKYNQENNSRKNHINEISNKKSKQKNCYKNNFIYIKIVNNNNFQRFKKRNDSYIRKCIGSCNSSKNNISKKKLNITKTDLDETDKKRNNSLIVSNRNKNIFNFDNNKLINININNNICDNNGFKGHCHSFQENKNNTSTSTVYSSVSNYNNTTNRERDIHKKILETSNPSFKYSWLSNRISEKNYVMNIKNKNLLTLSTQKERKSFVKNKPKEEEEDELKEFNFDEYKIITQLGQGTFGKIYLVQGPNKQLFSMKKIVLSEELDVQSVIKEYKMCYKIKHPNVIKILGVYNKKLDKTTYVVYVLMEVGLTDWEKEIKSYSDKHIEYTESELINIIKQLTSVLAFLQRKNISHRDIKPQNILVFKNNIYKIADFGEAKQIESISKSLVVNSLRGTELYMSPLLFNGLRTGQVDIKHNMFKSDVYSFGLCILYASVTSNKPLYETRKFVEMNSVRKYITKLLKNKYSSKFIQLLCTMIEIHEKNRPDFIELENIMKNWKN